jgi:type I restriction enzyme M protein
LNIQNFKGELVESCLTTKVDDGQLMFMLHMLSKMKSVEDGGSRIASVHNGSALFTGNAGGGESGIRQYILENDLLECIIQLPNDIFYNTGIATYVWILSNKKEKRRKGVVQLIDASDKKFYKKMRKSLGDKKVELLPEHILKIQENYFSFRENEFCKLFKNEDFGYYQISVHQPIKDEFGTIVKDSKGKMKSDSALKDTEKVPMQQGIKFSETIDKFFKREVKKYLPHAWYDQKSIKVGYEIPFTKFFYSHLEPKPLATLKSEIKILEQETEGLLKEIIK